eukprot:255287-Amphidinium_carterae.1
MKGEVYMSAQTCCKKTKALAKEEKRLNACTSRPSFGCKPQPCAQVKQTLVVASVRTCRSLSSFASCALRCEGGTYLVPLDDVCAKHFCASTAQRDTMCCANARTSLQGPSAVTFRPMKHDMQRLIYTKLRVNCGHNIEEAKF